MKERQFTVPYLGAIGLRRWGWETRRGAKQLPSSSALSAWRYSARSQTKKVVCWISAYEAKQVPLLITRVELRRSAVEEKRRTAMTESPFDLEGSWGRGPLKGKQCHSFISLFFGFCYLVMTCYVVIGYYPRLCVKCSLKVILWNAAFWIWFWFHYICTNLSDLWWEITKLWRFFITVNWINYLLW